MAEFEERATDTTRRIRVNTSVSFTCETEQQATTGNTHKPNGKSHQPDYEKLTGIPQSSFTCETEDLDLPRLILNNDCSVKTL